MASEVFDPKTALKRMRDRTSEAREAEAVAMFTAEKFDETMSAAAKSGQTSAAFAPSKPMDVSGTKTAKEFVRKLEAAGFVTEWKTRQQGEGEPWKWLRVSWGVDASR